MRTSQKLPLYRTCFSAEKVSQFCKNKYKLSIFNNNDTYFFCGQDNLLGGQFWAMDGFDLLGGQINLLGGQMPTQLTFFFFFFFFLPP